LEQLRLARNGGVLLKLDISNAFNTVSRNSPAMLAIALYCSGPTKSRR
jgi:hypothetical protein